MTDGESFFFADAPKAGALYETLAARIREALPGTVFEAKGTQITLKNRRVFGAASLPRRKADRDAGGLVVTVGLSYRLESPRVQCAVEPYPNRWTHHVPIFDARAIDDELISWLREAYAFAEGKA